MVRTRRNIRMPKAINSTLNFLDEVTEKRHKTLTNFLHHENDRDGKSTHHY